MLYLAPLLLAGAGALAAPAHRDSIPVSDHTVEFTGKFPVSKGRYMRRLEQLEYLRSLAAGSKHSKRSSTYTAGLQGPAGASEYSLAVTIGGTQYQVIADTGSSDLWLPSSKFQCVNAKGQNQAQSACDFGPTYFSDSTFQPLSYANNFNITYGDGTFVTGYAGTDTVSVGGLSVPNTEFSVGTLAYWQGDGYTDGLLGLANPLITSVFYSTNPTTDSNQDQAEYNPWFYTAVKSGAVAPYFSLVLNRPTFAEESGSSTVPSLGSITFGGVPSTPTTGTTATVNNVQFTEQVDGKTVTQPAYYTLQVDSFNFPGSTKLNTKTPLTILDSGTTLIYLPNSIAKAYNSKWSPAAHYDQKEGAYVVNCNAKAPSFSVTIGGQTFTTTAADLIYPAGNGKCISSILPGGSDQQNDVFILGDRFLVNVVSTFNIQNNQITVSQRSAYT